jgi:hypothetical protein
MAATYEQVIEALRRADQAGNTEDARQLAQLAATMRPAGGGRGVQGGPSAAELERASMTSYLAESAKRGLTATPARLTAGSAMQQGTFAGAFPTQPELEEFTTANIQRRMGVDVDRTPATAAQKYTGAFVEAASDPLNLIGAGPTMFTKGLSTLAGGTAGLFGELGGEIGKETGGPVGQIFAGLTAALAAGAGTMKAGQMLANKTAGVSDLLRGVDPDVLAKIEGTSKAQDLIQKAFEANPELKQRLEDVRKRMQFVTGNTGPLAVAGLDNLALETKLKTLAKNDVGLAAELRTLYTDLNNAVKNKANELYAAPSAELPSAKQRQQQVVQTAQQQQIAIDKQLKKITSDIDLFGSRDPLAEGKAIQNLVKTKEATIRKELSPQYDDVKKQASDQGALLPANETQSLLNTAEEIFINDPWAKQAGLLSLVRQQAAKFNKLRKDVLPRGEAGSLSTGEENMLVGMDITSLDSLKRRVSDDLYGKNKVTDPNRRDKLKLFQQYVDGALERVQSSSGNVEVTLRGERMSFADAMSTLDRDYYTKIGIDFRDAKSIAKLNSQEYAERVGTQLASEPTATDQFLKVAGDEGVPIVERAIMARMYNRALGSDGYLDPAKLNTLMSKDSQNGGFRDLLERVPALRDRLQDSSTRSLSLMAEKKAIDDLATQTKIDLGQGFLNDYEQGGVARIVSKMTGSTGKGYLAKFNNDLKALAPDERTNATLAVRNGLVTNMLDSSNPMDYLKKNKAAFDSIFGKKHTDNLLALADISALANKVDINRLNISETAVKEQSILEKALPGVDPKRLSNIAVNQIASVFNKGFRVFTLIGQSKIDEATKQAHKQLFLDNNGVENILKATTKFKNAKGLETDLAKMFSPSEARKLVNSVVLNMSRSAYLGGSTAASESTVTPITEGDEYIYMPE